MASERRDVGRILIHFMNDNALAKKKCKAGRINIADLPPRAKDFHPVDQRRIAPIITRGAIFVLRELPARRRLR